MALEPLLNTIFDGEQQAIFIDIGANFDDRVMDVMMAAEINEVASQNGYRIVPLIPTMIEGDAIRLALRTKLRLDVAFPEFSPVIVNCEDGNKVEDLSAGLPKFTRSDPPPFGYATKTVEMRGKKAKKELVVDEVTASVARQMYSLYLRGDCQNRPLGTKALTDWLNKNNFLTVNGKLWSVGQVHKLLKIHISWAFTLVKSVHRRNLNPPMPVQLSKSPAPE